jgi:arabinan endo-1,5-alpha-L-arabinosidase
MAGMKKGWRIFASLAAAALGLIGAESILHAQGPNPATTPTQATYTNPVFDRDFPDPNLEFGHDGYIDAYSTNTTWSDLGPKGGQLIPIIRSKDLVHWDYVGTVLSAHPTWKTDGGVWAPDVTFFNGKYYCYYAVSTWGDGNPGIGLATADKAVGPFTDQGKVFLSSEIGVTNCIDPVLVVEGSQLYLFFGSFHGIYGVQLTPNGAKPAGQPFQIADGNFEGSFIFKKAGYYYYLGSSGTCCDGANSTYHLLVGRATSLEGPYTDKDGKPLLQGGGTMFLHADGKGVFVGTGHNGDVLRDDTGTYWIVYHAYHKSDPGKGRVLMLDRVDWIDGWPRITNDEPSTTPQPVPVFNNL